MKKENIIFYFSGTGNSFQVARDLAGVIGNCDIVNIAEFNLATDVTGKRIGLVFPIYYFGPPLIVNRFLEQVKLPKDAYTYAVATFGLWPGKAIDMVGNTLQERGVTLNAGFLIRMPDNYILAYGARSQALQEKCFRQEKEKVRVIGDNIMKQRCTIEKSKFFVDRLISNQFYKSHSRKFADTGKYFSADENCNGCGLCVNKCPVNNIQLTDNSPQWSDHCEACLACIQYCPKQAINYKDKTQKRERYINPNV